MYPESATQDSTCLFLFYGGLRTAGKYDDKLAKVLNLPGILNIFGFRKHYLTIFFELKI